MKNKLSAFMAMAAAVSFTGCSARPGGNPDPSPVVASNVTLTAAQRQNIHLYTVEPSAFHQTVEATGTVDFDQDQASTVLAPFGGPVTKLFVSLGARVKAGERLARVDSPDFAMAVSTYRKALVAASTARQLANLDHDLLRHHGISEREAAQAESDAASAEADRDAALQELASLKVDPLALKAIQEGKAVPHIDGIIRSPIAGTVVEKLITPGQLLQAATTPCFTVANLSNVWVMARLFGSDIGSVRVGDPAEVDTGFTSSIISGIVENIADEVNPDNRSVEVRVAVNNPGDVLKKNMYVSVWIRSRRENTGLLVPDSAILRDSENLPFVYTAQPDGTFAREHVTLGYRDGDRYQITSGIKPGEHIVVEGGIFVQFLQNQ